MLVWWVDVTVLGVTTILVRPVTAGPLYPALSSTTDRVLDVKDTVWFVARPWKVATAGEK
jgi:hypothetical protein